MANLNKVMLIGRLTRDPVSRATTGGMAICEFGMAMNRNYRTASGEEKEEVCFIEVSIFGKQGDLAFRSLHKGNMVFLEGRLRFENWKDKDGNSRNRLSVVGDHFQYLTPKNQENSQQDPNRRGDASSYYQNSNQRSTSNGVPAPNMTPPPPPTDEFIDDSEMDIETPF